MSTASDLQTSWQRAWASLDLTPEPRLLDELLAAWGQPQRHYHSLRHLGECIDHLSRCLDLTTHSGEVELALWFHDAVYDPQGSGNEERSADWAQQALQAAGASADMQARVRELILATRHDALPCGPDEQLLVDIDLSILGAAPRRFKQYDEQVRAEYAWVPEALYRSKRSEVLAGLAARQPLYATAFFQQRCEAQARANLQAALDALK